MTETTQERSTKSAYGLRALAHPLRWMLIDLLDSEESATATRCAETLGESVASCSYHLSILAKYGYIELVPGIGGREKPWRLTSTHQDLSPSSSDPYEVFASQAASEAFLEHELDQIKVRLHHVSLESPEWRAASAAGGSSVYVTASELDEIKEEMMTVLFRYADRQSDPDSRPANARRARVFFSTTVDPSR
jgi:hypothetical protein